MNSRERVKLALNFEQPDRVPFDFWASRGFYRSLGAARGLTQEAFLDLYDVDFRYIAGPTYRGPALRDSARGEELDLWGVPRRTIEVAAAHGTEFYDEVVRYPLADARKEDDVERYRHWPSADWFDYSDIRNQCEAVRRKERVVVFMGDRLNRVAQLKPAMYLRGVERILTDLVESPEIACAIFRRIRSFYNDYLTRILEAAGGMIDIVLTGDDFGSQQGLLISPAMWEEYLGQGFRQYMEIIRSSGAVSMHHTCGLVTPLVPKLVENGLRVLQSLQPEVMAPDFPRLKEQYGRRLAFQGGISIQQTLPHGTAAQIRSEVEARVGTLGRRGGYILCTAHNVQADCSIENVEALLQAYRAQRP